METEAVLRIVFASLSYSIIVISLIPFIRSPQWYIRIFDYPRSQKFWINTVLIVAFSLFAKGNNTHDLVLLFLLVANEIYLLSLIWPYLPLAPKQMKRNVETFNAVIKIFIANVFQDNKDFNRCIQIIKRCDPDIFMLVETDESWLRALKGFKDRYPYRITKPQSNTYGIVLFSKLEIVNYKIRFLIEKDIPSIVADVKTKEGSLFKLYGLHPKPPVPEESAESTERDAEILIIGKEAKACKQPVIVAGDLNDVAWSYTTRLFLKVSGLLDPRRGRGFYSTFHAQHRLFRWPLDHVFCSSHFYLQKLERLPSIGSDHFPIFIQVALMSGEITENKKEEKKADADELALAQEMIEAAQ